MNSHDNLFSRIISVENLFYSWTEFKDGKRNRKDVRDFERNLEDNLFALHYELKDKSYRHSDYTSFFITDPKVRHIHKADVRDRIIHHAIYRILYPIFDEGFIHDSYSCRLNKGTHKAIRRLENFTRKVSKNYTAPCFALKCDIKKFFDSVDHEILLELLKKKITDEDVLSLLKETIQSFNRSEKKQLSLFENDPICSKQIKRERERERERERDDSLRLFGKGIPIGNLTSQLFANVYMHEFDKFVKHTLKAKCYLRYCDDFIILSNSEEYLAGLISQIVDFLGSELKLKLHEHKVSIRKLNQGIDFLGYVVLPHHTVLRAKTKKRMLRRVNKNNLSSYLSILKHCNGFELRHEVLKLTDQSN